MLYTARLKSIQRSGKVLRSAQNQSPITNAITVTRLSRHEGDKRHPVEIRGTVTFFGRVPTVLFVQDRTGGIFINVGTIIPNCRSGDEVTVRGYTEPGRFTPVVAMLSIETSGPGALPAPAPVSIPQLWKGGYDCQYIQVRGYVRQYSFDGTLTKLELVDREHSLTAWVQGFPKCVQYDLLCQG